MVEKKKKLEIVIAFHPWRQLLASKGMHFDSAFMQHITFWWYVAPNLFGVHSINSTGGQFLATAPLMHKEWDLHKAFSKLFISVHYYRCSKVTLSFACVCIMIRCEIKMRNDSHHYYHTECKLYHCTLLTRANGLWSLKITRANE